jgi:hypothetical protein
MRVGVRAVLAVASLAVAGGIGTVAVPHATAAGRSQLHPPTLLWKAYPLVQRPRAPALRKIASETRNATGPTSAQSRQLDDLLLLTALLATLLAAGTVVFMRKPAAARGGGSTRGRAANRTPRPARRPRPRRPRAPAIAVPPPPDVTADDLADADADADAEQEQEPTPEPPPDELQRVLDDLLGALQPRPELDEPQARIPELELRELIVRKYTAPASARPFIEREIDAALERIEIRRAAEARARAAARTTLARGEIRLWRGVVRSRLYAVITGSEKAFAVSQPFRSGDAAAPGAQAQRALFSFLAELTRAGWTVVDHGAAWYEHTLALFAPDPDAGSTDVAAEPDEVQVRVVYRSAPRENRPEDETT